MTTALVANSAPHFAQTVVFIDSRVENAAELISANQSPDQSWVLINTNEDGLLQMQRTLQGLSGLDAIHVVSHGSQGALHLGSTVLNSSNLSA